MACVNSLHENGSVAGHARVSRQIRRLTFSLKRTREIANTTRSYVGGGSYTGRGGIEVR